MTKEIQNQALAALEEFKAKMTALLRPEAVDALTGADVNLILDQLRREGIWGPDNDNTFKRLCDGGRYPSQALAVFESNPRIRELIDAVILGREVTPCQTSVQ